MLDLIVLSFKCSRPNLRHSIASLSLCLCISSYSARSDVHRVSGRHYVSVVLIHCLPMDTPYILGHVVDHGCDTPVESFVVHSLNIGMHIGCSYKGREALFLIFLSNIPCVDIKMILVMITRCNCTNQSMF